MEPLDPATPNSLSVVSAGATALEWLSRGAPLGASPTPLPVGFRRVGGPKPLTFPSLEHMDDRWERVQAHLLGIEGQSGKTLDGLRCHYRLFRGFLSGGKVAESWLGGDPDQQLEILRAWVGHLREQGRSHSTINNYWRGLKAIFEAMSQLDGTFNPLSLCRAPRPGFTRKRSLPQQTVETIFLSLLNRQGRSDLERWRDLALAGTYFYAGLRNAEGRALHVVDVDVEVAQIHVRHGKGRNGGVDRIIPMAPELRDIYDRYLALRKRARKTHVFFLTSVTADTGIGDKTVLRIFQRISRDTRVHVTPHMLRYSLVGAMNRTGVAPAVGMAITGHRTLRMYQHYSQVESEDVRAAADRVRLDIDFTRPPQLPPTAV